MRHLFVLSLLLLAACGTPPDPNLDGGLDAGADAAILPPVHCRGDALLIAALAPAETITLFNPTDEAIVLAGTEWVLCQRPNYVALDVLEPGVTIGPRSAHTFSLPPSFSDATQSGEIALYRQSAFTVAEALVDFVCWGEGRASSRLSVAEEDGDWSGACTPAILSGGLSRRANTDGRDASSYDSREAAPSLSCP